MHSVTNHVASPSYQKITARVKQVNNLGREALEDKTVHFYRRQCAAGDSQVVCTEVVDGGTYVVNGRRDVWHVDGADAI